MPNFVKNAMNQIEFVMVDKTDFATIESTITESDFNSAATKKFYGVNHGVSDAFTSGTISKTTKLVRSGIFQQTLKAAETNYDYIIYRFTHPSCADQILIFQPAEIDPSDVYSLLSDFRSDFQSRVPKAVATNSQLSDLHSDLRSFLVVMSGIQSDILSAVSDMQSDFQSRVPKAVATNSQLSDLHSDLKSYLTGMSGMQSDIYSSLSDLQSDFQSRVPKRVATDSQLSDALSDLRSFMNAGISAAVQGNSRILVVQSRVSDVESALDSQFAYNSNALSDLGSQLLINQSRVSDIYSLLSDVQSDFQSRVPKRVATDSQLSDALSDIKSAVGATALSASDLSDIASAVNTVLASVLSDALSAAVQANSRILVVQSRVSDIESAVDSQFAYNSNALSDLGSQLLINQSRVSDIYSLLSDVQSDFQSRVPKRVATDSQLSDVLSDVKSAIGAGGTVNLSASDLSDIRSAIAAVTVTLSASDVSDIASAVVAGIAGGGTKTVTINVEDNGLPLEGADVWVTSDLAGTNIIARNYSNTLGIVTFYLDPGTYYFWKQLSGYNFTNPEARTVT